MRTRWLQGLLLSCLLLCPAHAALADAPGLQLVLEAYGDDATLSRSRNIGNTIFDEEELEVGRGLAFAVGLNYLIPITDFLRLGPGARYLSSYRYSEEADDSDTEVLLGRLFEFYVRGEFAISLPEEITLTPALEIGMPLLLPAGALQEDLNGFERLGFNVNDLPRIGVLVGAELSLRYPLTEWLFVRGGLGLQHDRIILYNASADGGNGEVESDLAIMRVRVLAGVEAQLGSD